MSGRRGEPAGGQSNTQSAPRQNVYFVPRDGIDREVITADICRYLGRDALVRPGTYTDPATGQLLQGYHITAYRNLTSAMIQDLKNDSARWESERRKHNSGGGSSRYGGYGGAQGQQQYESSELPSPYPSGLKRDSYEVLVPRYPGSDAPGYSGSGSGGGGSGSTYQQQYDQGQQAQGYNGQYPPQGQPYPPQAGAPGYPQQGGNSAAYTQQYSGSYNQDTGPPYVNVGANYSQAPADPRAVDSSSGRVYSSSTYPSQAQVQADPRGGYYSQGQVASGYTQPVDPFLGRGNYPATTQADYNTSAQPAPYQYDPQYETQNQTPPPRAVTSPSTSTQAQTGHSSGSSHTRHHRDRDQRDGSYIKSERHSRRP